jgi:hypothetical protein
MSFDGGLYHVGIVVPDLEAGRARFGELLSLTWGPVNVVDPFVVRDGEGNDLEHVLRMCYSTREPYVELIEAIPGSIWELNEHSNLHHIGVWADSIPVDSDALHNMGCPLQLAGREGDTSPVHFAYHADEHRVRIELVDIAAKATMDEFMFNPPVA